MSDTPDSTDEMNPKPKKRNLADLLPAKTSVETSLGPLYVRHASTKDWKHFESNDTRELGRALVRQLCSRNEVKNDSEPLAEEDFKALDDADFRSLVPVIAKQNGWEKIPADAGLEVLGDVAKAERQQLLDSHKNMLADMRKSIDSSYGFLGKGALDKLQEQMAGLVDIRSGAMSSVEALRAAMRTSSRPIDELKRALGPKSMYDKEIREADSVVNLRGIEAAPTRDPPLFLPPRPENTLLGRATLESAEHSRETAQKMDALVDVVAGLNQTVVKDILPAWVKQVETGQTDAKKAFEQAAKGLKWTWFAIIISVIVTFAATLWQVSVSIEIDRENTEQQERVEAILSKQLETQQDLIMQQAREAVAMREAIAALKSLGSGVAQKK